MALAIRVVLLDLLIIIISLVLRQLIKVDAQKFQESGLKKCRFDRIYQFGDSLSDTGNCLRESFCGANSACRKLPYGMNVFKKATGRCSDGMLMIDFIGIYIYIYIITL